MDSLYTYANLMTGNQHQAGNLVHDVYSSASRSVNDDVARENIQTHLFRTLRNMVIRSHTADAAERGNGIQQSENSANDPSALLLGMIVSRSIRSMPEEYGSAVVLSDAENFTYTDIAEIMNCSPEEADFRVREGRKLLRKKLNGLFEYLFSAPTKNSIRKSSFEKENTINDAS
jgi:DNA-directed RNA polymerase specialized sigma24 family protein